MFEVRAVPTGKESGVFYGIDLGGTNLRILRKNLPNGELRQLKRRIPDAGRSGSASDLFGFIATAVRDLAKECNDTGLFALSSMIIVTVESD